jgi:hypothetical protein
MRGQDLLNALADELRDLSAELAAAYDSGSESYGVSLARLSEAAGYMGLSGVQRIAAAVSANLEHVTQQQDERVLVRSFFTDWPRLLEAHLRDARSAAHIDKVVEHFGGGWVPLPLEGTALQELRAELAAANSIGAALD